MVPSVSFTHDKGDSYLVTGVDRDGKRFRIQTSNPYYALGINIWCGTLWQLKSGQKRKKLKRVVN